VRAVPPKYANPLPNMKTELRQQIVKGPVISQSNWKLNWGISVSGSDSHVTIKAETHSRLTYSLLAFWIRWQLPVDGQ